MYIPSLPPISDKVLEKMPLWKLKLDEQIDYHRKHFNQIKQFISTPKVPGKQKNKIIRLCAKLKCNLEDVATELGGKYLSFQKN